MNEFLGTVLMILLWGILFFVIGRGLGMDKIREQAIDVGVAEWVQKEDNPRQTEFKWITQNEQE
jgi:hypothetical protein